MKDLAMHSLSRDSPRRLLCEELPHLPDELLSKVFLKSDAKTVGRYRALNKSWSVQLTRHDFVKEHWDENSLKRCSIIVGVGPNQTDDNSQWLFRADLEKATQVQLNIPTTVNQEVYTIVGSDRGIICLQLARPSNRTRLMVWNPLTGEKRYVSYLKSTKYLNYDLSVYAFGFPEGSMYYIIVNAYKRNIEDPTIHFRVYHPLKFSCSESRKFNLCVSKIEPNHVVEGGVVHWIGWGGEQASDPLNIITFDMNVNKFYETEVPAKAKGDYHAITKCNGGVCFFSQTKVELGMLVQL